MRWAIAYAWIGILLAPIVSYSPCFAAVEPSDDGAPAAVLKRAHVEPTAAGVLEHLGRWQPTAENRERIKRLVTQLGSESYPLRETAGQELANSGPLAEAALREAAQSSDDLEVVLRARRLVVVCRHGPAEDVLVASLAWLKQNPSPKAAPIILDIVGTLPDALQQAACETLWACTTPGDAPRLRQAIGDARPAVRAAAIPAYELAAGAGAVNEIMARFADKDEVVRLAAARALIDRVPAAAIAAIVGLTDARDANVRLQAAWLLQQASDIPADNAPPADFDGAVRQWKHWASTAAAAHPKPLGTKRLQVSRFGTILYETFHEDAADIGHAYRQLQYESDVEGKASVRAGKLRLDGNHREGDQRLCAKAQRLIGAETFPRRFKVKATLGGEGINSGGWHVGVSVGNIRFLFHPAASGGMFRAERVDDHRYVMSSTMMPFTQAPDVLHEMTIDVTKNDDGSVRLDVAVLDGSKTTKRYASSVTVAAPDIGPLRRVALERSGREGGAALFGSFIIENAGLGEK
jgi:HEAT repeat protein